MNLDADLIAQAVAEHGAGAQYGNTTGMHKHAFDNPAAWKDQPVVWIPDDTLGLGRSEVDRMGTQKVDASCEYATMDEKGHVEIQRGPPDEVSCE
jgi:calcium permeable stress-gated cation channel